MDIIKSWYFFKTNIKCYVFILCICVHKQYILTNRPPSRQMIITKLLFFNWIWNQGQPHGVHRMLHLGPLGLLIKCVNVVILAASSSNPLFQGPIGVRWSKQRSLVTSVTFIADTFGACNKNFSKMKYLMPPLCQLPSSERCSPGTSVSINLFSSLIKIHV